MSEFVRLDPESVRAVALAVVELLRGDAGEAGQSAGRLLTAAEVAVRFSVARAWVYSHADELGAIRLGEGSKPRLRFEAATVARALRSRSAGERSGQATSALRRASRLDASDVVPNGLESLPERWRAAVRGGQAA